MTRVADNDAGSRDADRVDSWRPSASFATLALRARLLAATRAFFAARGLLEVETPMLVNAPVTDVNLHSATAQPGVPGYLATSPEYAMKRLLAAGSGDIFQVCKVVRAGERGRLHNPEFTMIEWYRAGAGLEQIALETAELVNTLRTEAGAQARPVQRLAYRDAFQQALGCDPLLAPLETLHAALQPLGLAAATWDALTRDECLDLLVGARIGPTLGLDSLCVLERYPASQAALARLDPDDPRVALRFELYADGVELANGFEELADPHEQRARFAADNAERARRGLSVLPVDERLLAALTHGLPPCAGVAVGFDRVLMTALGATHIDAVLAFAAESA